MNGKCGRCRGRRVIRELAGLGVRECPDCDGTGIRVQKASLGASTVTIPLPTGARCKVCGELAIHQHHVVAQQRLNRYISDPDARRRAKADIRNAVPLCFECHHRVEVGSLPLEPSDLHPQFARFVRQYDLAAALPRHLAGVVA
jgi:hypothetical protein